MMREDDEAQPQREVEGNGQSSGIPAAGQHPDPSSPTGGRGQRHWQEATITEPGLDYRANVFFAAIEMTRMPMVLSDPNLPDNPIVFCNRAFQDLTGYDSAEVIGRNCRFLQGANTDRATVAALREAIAAEQAVSVELLNYRRDGSPFWNGVYIAPVHDMDGKLLYFFASQLDVTRRRTSEQAMRQAQKMESIGQLTAGLAHDFNNLLQVVLGNLESARGRVTEERTLRMLRNATAAAERGAKLTRQLLAFARRTRLEPRRILLNTLIREFDEMLASTAGGRVALRYELHPDLPPIEADPVHLEMALLNVVINARDATPEGGTVTIGTGVRRLEPNGLPGGDYVELWVRDTGVGMPPHVLDRATEPFFTTKSKDKGTGLGLAMVHGFTQQSRGRLYLESEEGAGTLVRMTFPVAREDRLSAQDAERQDGAGGRSTPGTATVLVVEDSDDVRALAIDQLETLGYRVLAARSGEAALAMLDSADPPRIDLLFSDIVMPGGMNGLALAEQVGARQPDAAILLTTGYNDELVADGPRAATMDVLGKPYRRAELADRIRAALERRGSARADRPSTGTEHAG